MPDGVLLEFDGVTVAQYHAVNERLGIDPETGEGAWPDGMISHAGGAKPGGLVVFEVWESRADQERFMHDRLGRALQEGGITAPPARVEWLELAGYSTADG
ncbi:hypothetical protein FSW04_19480 [Baekduia soli]|uniref:ABM domain-containing protein n=1 Tax=Baekduia soli TaxID=496014 RepID=A0A5B8U8T6_9ACTN|nr:hypothetical protein [Baekduia soli]QEC49536.1 hypothetical protein FSW04_19480 [Baekduia soli]